MPDRPRVTGAILAAGFSRRLGRPKQLLPFQGKPLLQWAVDAALASELDEVLVVLGAAAPEILDRIELGPARAIVNDRAIEGQSSSIAAAVSSADPDRLGTLLMLGDQPTLRAADLERVLAAFDGRWDSIATASWQGEARSPVVFGRAFDPELVALTGDAGARRVISAHRDHVRFVEFDRSVPIDIDTDEDYRRLLSNEAVRS